MAGEVACYSARFFPHHPIEGKPLIDMEKGLTGRERQRVDELLGEEKGKIDLVKLDAIEKAEGKKPTGTFATRTQRWAASDLQ
ncbi:hypothetical protein [Brucella oryzae]|nr:hypothetical protein [Brucella oryzae]